jgi:hypothetical protein
MNSDMEVTAFKGNGHPDEHRILLALERELPDEGLAEIEKHLGECWSCRARLEEMRRGILAFVEYRENRYLPSLAGPPNEFRNFPGELRDVIAESDSAGVKKRLREAFSALLALPASVRWSAAVALVTAVALFWTQVLFNPVAVSANELLARAIAAQNPSTPKDGIEGKRKTIHQKVQIRSGARTVVRDFTWTAGSLSPRMTWEMKDDLEKWNSPLTAEGFAAWRNSLPAKDDAVTRSRQFLTLTTTPQIGPITKASIVVRSTDFHPLEQHILFADDQKLDFLELGFEIREEVAPLAQRSPPQKSSPNPASSDKTHRNLDDMELAVRYKLFSEKLDLGEDLQIKQTGSEVVVAGIASSKERADAILALLSGADGVRVKVTFPQPANASTLPANPTSTSSRNSQIRSTSPLGEDLLSKEFPSSNERAYFVNAWLAASDKALSHAWAMRRLAERYSEKEESKLSSESVDRLREMLRTHLEAVGQSNADMDSLLKLLPNSAESQPPSVTDLRSGVMLLFRNVQEQDSLVAKLVASAPEGGGDLATTSQKLRKSHHAVQVLSVGLRDLLEAR